MTAADQRRVRKALDGLAYPAGKPSIVAYAEQRGADQKTRTALHALPAGRYGSIAEVENAIPQAPAEGLDHGG